MPELRERYHVRSLDLFGSYVRGEESARSDLDVLVEFVVLQYHLSDLVGVKVDLVSRGAQRADSAWAGALLTSAPPFSPGQLQVLQERHRHHGQEQAEKVPRRS